jgi:hypothetical protein
MPAKLVSRSIPGRRLAVEFADTATLGRDAGSTLALPAEVSTVSKSHARIAYDPARRCYVLEDLGSANGTMLDGRPIQTPTRLGRMHVITLGKQVEVVFHDLAFAADLPAPAVGAPGRADAVAPAPRGEAAPPAAVPTRPELREAPTRVEGVETGSGPRGAELPPTRVENVPVRSGDERETRVESE